MTRSLALRSLATLVALLGIAVGRAGAATLIVAPGPGSPVQDAIDAAQPGDRVVLSAGVYDEAIAITKPLKLVGNPPLGTVVLDAGCAAPIALEVASDGVAIQRIVIRRGAVSDVALNGVSTVRLTDVWTHGPGFSGGCPGTQYGLDVTRSSQVSVRRSVFVGSTGAAATGYGGAAIYVHGIADGAEVAILKTNGLSSRYGILVGDISGGAAARTLAVKKCGFARNDTGVLLADADGTRIIGNDVQDNGTAGISVDSGSDENLLVGNRVTGSATDVSDAGVSNCWIGNSFTTGTVPTGGCP